MNKHGMLLWILAGLALGAVWGAVLQTGSGCALLGLTKATNAAIDDVSKKINDELSPDNVDEKPGEKPSVAKQVEIKIGFWLGLGAGLTVLATIVGGIILIYLLIQGKNIKLGIALYAGGILGTVGIYATAIILPALRWIVLGVLVLIVILVLAGLGWVLYQVFVLHRGFFEVVACFQRKKRENWDKEAIDFMNKNQAPETRKLVRDIKAQLPKVEASEPVEVNLE